jgi:hypothetical protein
VRNGGLDKPAAWLHTLWMEGGQHQSEISFTKKSPFGKRGVNYSRHYIVTSEPLYRRGTIIPPVVRL